MKPDDRSKIVDLLKQIIRSELSSSVDLANISEDVPLFEDGIGLDSISIVNLIVEIERHFGIEFEEDRIDPKTFSDLRSLSTYIAQRLTASTHGVNPEQ